MHKSISLAAYVKKRNGLPLGADGSLKAMLIRSLGAESFYVFWQYWNPIWGFYLSRNIMRPLNKIFPVGISILLTFAVSGALHDLAVTLFKWRITFFFTPWFTLMGAMVLLSKSFDITYKTNKWLYRMFCNLLFILISFAITFYIVTFRYNLN